MSKFHAFKRDLLQQLAAAGARGNIGKMASKHPPHQPIIAVIGTTGTGKSQLAVDLALRYNGEIINADAVQLYEGLPIITNKIPPEERRDVPHHLLGCIGLDDASWRVDRYVKEAGAVIQEIRERGKLPIVVGGTHYYTQSLLFRDSLAEEENATTNNVGEVEEVGRDEVAETHSILKASVDEMLEKLREVDPVMARRWHPQDARKIRRSLEIYYKTGRKASEIYAEQQAHAEGQKREDIDGNANGDQAMTGLRHPTLFFWTHTPRDLLVPRLRIRVDKMVDDGLLDEARHLQQFAKSQEATGKGIDTTRGVYISIGYKELLPYFCALDSGDKKEKDLDKLLDEGIEQVKTATAQYAKYQDRWIRIKLLRAVKQARAEHSIFLLDTSDTKRWQTNIPNSATLIVDAFLGGHPNPITNHSASATANETLAAALKAPDDNDPSVMPQTQTCEICNVAATTEKEWRKHVDSGRHKKILKSKQRRASQEWQGPRNGRAVPNGKTP